MPPVTPRCGGVRGPWRPRPWRWMEPATTSFHGRPASDARTAQRSLGCEDATPESGTPPPKVRGRTWLAATVCTRVRCVRSSASAMCQNRLGTNQRSDTTNVLRTSLTAKLTRRTPRITEARRRSHSTMPWWTSSLAAQERRARVRPACPSLPAKAPSSKEPETYVIDCIGAPSRRRGMETGRSSV